MFVIVCVVESSVGGASMDQTWTAKQQQHSMFDCESVKGSSVFKSPTRPSRLIFSSITECCFKPPVMSSSSPQHSQHSQHFCVFQCLV